jgi:hypothetical protein
VPATPETVRTVGEIPWHKPPATLDKFAIANGCMTAVTHRGGLRARTQKIEDAP